MRILPLVVATFLACAGFAGDLGRMRPATEHESDFMYLGVLNSMPFADALEMLTGVGVDEVRARELLDYLTAHLDDQRQAQGENAAKLCRNPDDRFSDPLVLANELRRWRQAEHRFQSSLIEKAKQILEVDSLRPVRRPHMNDGGTFGLDTVQRILDGVMKPADVIARTCESLERSQAQPLPDAELL